MKHSKIEWKDTKLPFCIDEEYPLAVRNRFIFFYCKSRNFRKMINYAENFCNTNSICAVFIYGDISPKSLINHLEQKKQNIVCIVFDRIAKTHFEELDNYDKLIKKLTCQGLWDKELNQPCHMEFISDECAEQIKYYKQVLSEVKSIQHGRATAYSNFVGNRLEVSEDHAEFLIGIAKATYPYGIEADTDNEYAYKSVAARKIINNYYCGKASDEKLNCKIAGEEYQLSLFEDHSVGATEAVNSLTALCESCLKADGYFDIGMIVSTFSNKPFGFYKCNWYLYILAVILAKFNRKPMLYRSAMITRKLPTEQFADFVINSGGIIFEYDENQKRLMSAMKEIFGVSEECVDTHSVAYYAIANLVKSDRQLPLSYIDERYSEMLVSAVGCSNVFCSRCQTEKYYSLIENTEKHREIISNSESIILDKLKKKYAPEKVDLFYKFYHVRGSAAVWLHSREFFIERVETYMKCEICRECGRPLVHNASEKFTVDGEAGTLDFTLKDITGLNKKLLGRYQNEYFCIPCLCEVLDTTNQELHDKIHEFKEAGCELF